MRDDDVGDGKWRKKSSLGRSIVYLVDCASLSRNNRAIYRALNRFLEYLSNDVK